MAVSNLPIFEQTPKIGGLATQVSTANVKRDGTDTIEDIITGGTNGTRIDHIDIVATVTTTDGVIRLFISSGAGTPRLGRKSSCRPSRRALRCRCGPPPSTARCPATGWCCRAAPS
jgi:hypothetical protein